MALLIIEYYSDGSNLTNVSENIYGVLLSSHEDSTVTTGVESSAKPGNATYCSIFSDTACYLEMGPGAQDVTLGRRVYIDAGERRDFLLSASDTHVSYRTVV